MRILCAPNALKGSLSATAAAEAMADGIQSRFPNAEVLQLPIADGGDGLVDVLPGERQSTLVEGPLGEPVQAAWLWQPERRCAIIELAQASGLALCSPEQLDAAKAHSFGCGQVLAAALDRGAQEIVLGIGGSACTDGGTGLCRALGMRFLDEDGTDLPLGGAALGALARVDRSGLHPALATCALRVLVDVDNPLCGPEGAAAVYGPQKGADVALVETLNQSLHHLAVVLGDDANQPGDGAAGGVGFGARVLLGAEALPGAEAVLDVLDCESALAACDLVLTAEGRLDAQSRFGKAPMAVVRRARRRSLPAIAIAGSFDSQALLELQAEGLTAAFSLCPGPVELAEACAQSGTWLAVAAAQAVAVFAAGRGG
jgi:glycerate kinase